jgi:hypothetical protein
MEDFTNFLPRTEEEYLKTRVPDQINWYDKKSILNKRSFLTLKISEIILALLIPFLSGYIDTGNILKLAVGVLGACVAMVAGLVTLKKYQENWIEYRTVAESLKLEKYLFLANAGPYKDISNPYSVFVERFESLISNSTKKWMNYVSNKESELKRE